MRISRRKRYIRPAELQLHYHINRQITAPEVRVIDEEGKHAGIMPIAGALALAEERGYDLVEISPKEQPPVVRLIAYGQFKYEKEKEARKQKARQKEVEVKGIRLSLRIGEHDLDVRREQAKRFLERGDKVQIEIVLRGRERQHVDLARTIMEKFVAALKKDLAVAVEQPFSKQGGRLTLLIART